ncbi:acetyltransferase [Candidatus Marinimicrobia bacterium]|jgi:acetyltransferase EpsM|nr:acetyltransferase [Candidatus Neomarinimicrobiota bacterium]
MKKLIVYGAGEFGSLIANVISYYDDYQIVAYGDDEKIKNNNMINGAPILNQTELLSFAKKNNIKFAISSIGNNFVRAEKYNLLKKAGFQMISITHPQALIDTNVNYGDNVIIEMGTAIHTHSIIGNNVFLGGDALIGHHNIIGNHVLVGGNVSFGGSVTVEDYVSIGVGASIKPGITLGEGSVIGVGAAVIKNVDPNTTVVGVPAKAITK